MFFLLAVAGLVFSPGISYSKGDVYVCYEKKIHVGQSMDTVRAALGEPLRIEPSDSVGENDQSYTEVESDQDKPGVVISKWIYRCESRTYRFVFKNQNLVEILLIKETNAE
jgi:hypothetical protein